MKVIKSVFNFLLGDIGALLSALLTLLVSFFIFPVFIKTLTLEVPFAIIIQIFMGMFAVGFALSSIGTAISLISKGQMAGKDKNLSGIQKTKIWIFVILGVLIIIANILIVVLSTIGVL